MTKRFTRRKGMKCPRCSTFYDDAYWNDHHCMHDSFWCEECGGEVTITIHHIVDELIPLKMVIPIMARAEALWSMAQSQINRLGLYVEQLKLDKQGALEESARQIKEIEDKLKEWESFKVELKVQGVSKEDVINLVKDKAAVIQREKALLSLHPTEQRVQKIELDV